jgi:uncharacterized protein with HEPN domain
MSKRADSDYLSDILEAMHRIKEYTDSMTYDQFLNDIKSQDAVIRNLETIGEASKCLTLRLRKKYADISWKGMAGVRDRLIHQYFGVNLDIIWDIVTVELPDLVSKIESILQHEQ